MKHCLIALSLFCVASCGGGNGGGGGGGNSPSGPSNPSGTFKVGGTLSGLSSGNVVLQVNGADNLSLSGNGAFTFNSGLAAGAAYSVTVFTAPAALSCSVTNGAGAIVSANVTNVVVTCDTGAPQTWVGTGSSVSAAINANAQVTWTLESVIAKVATYRPSGTATAVVPGCTISPAGGAVIPTGGVLFVDYNTTPPSYHGDGLTLWSATWACPPQPAFVNGVVASYFGGGSGTLGVEAVGQVTANGTTIQGTQANTGISFTWTFTRR